MNNCDKILIWNLSVGFAQALVHVLDAERRMSRFAPFEVKSRYLLALCHLSIALARLYYLGSVVSVYFTGTVRERACTTSVL